MREAWFLLNGAMNWAPQSLLIVLCGLKFLSLDPASLLNIWSPATFKSPLYRFSIAEIITSLHFMTRDPRIRPILLLQCCNSLLLFFRKREYASIKNAYQSTQREIIPEETTRVRGDFFRSTTFVFKALQSPLIVVMILESCCHYVRWRWIHNRTCWNFLMDSVGGMVENFVVSPVRSVRRVSPSRLGRASQT